MKRNGIDKEGMRSNQGNATHLPAKHHALDIVTRALPPLVLVEAVRRPRECGPFGPGGVTGVL
jgi:hypothetical protein